MNPEPTVFVVDDDPGMRRALCIVCRAAGLDVEDFESAAAFLEDYDPAQPGCLVLDIRMPGLSGLELQDRLRAQRSAIPIIFITGHGDVPAAVRAVQAGALDFLEKPFDTQRLLDRIGTGFKVDAERRRRQAKRKTCVRRLGCLTSREREVMDLLVAGRTSKEIAGDLGITVQTVSVHRNRIFERMGVGSVVELTRLMFAAGVETG